MCIDCEIINTLRRSPKTADQIADEIGVLFMTVRPAVSKLKSRGIVVDSGEIGLSRHGRPAKKWKIAEDAQVQENLF